MAGLQDKASSPRRKRWWSLSVASLATLVVTADSGQLSIALPVIIGEFNADITLAGWIALVYALVTASLYMPCGRLSDLVGIGNLFKIGFLVYAASSLAAGLSQDAAQLILFRALQGMGSALIMANNFALVTALFPPAERGRAMGIAGGTVSALGYSLGPVIGGLFTHALGWRSNFYLSATLAVVGFAAARTLLPAETLKGSAERRSSFDFVGAAAFSVSISLLLVALTMAQKGSWRDPLITVEIACGFVMLAFFILWEKYSREPLLDLALFRIPAFALGNVARWISFVTMSINNLLMPFFIQVAMGLDPLRAGFLVAPTPFAMAVTAPFTGWLSERLVPEHLGALGMATTTLAFIGLSFLQPTATALEVVFWLTLLGLGMGIFQTPNNNLLMSSVPRERLGIGSSFLSIVRSVGYSTGAALGASIVSAQLVKVSGKTSLQEFQGGAGLAQVGPMLEAFLLGFRYACLTAAAICLAGAAVSAIRVTRR
ncbi:MAG: MFS transporter [Deltaproteobacteria bacterium]|nr:MFS transporter [Deltaproteobacteria bacterium]